jgi:hypothetical protein
MEHVLKVFAENCRKIWEERNLIALHRPIFIAFGVVVFLLTGAIVGIAEYAWFSNSITSRDNEIHIKNATIENLQNQPATKDQFSSNNPLDYSPLTKTEMAAIAAELSSLKKGRISIYNVTHGDALARTFEYLFAPTILGWDTKIDHTNQSVNEGITIYPNNAAAQAIAEAIRKGTKGRLRPKVEETNIFWWGRDGGDYRNDLIFGRIDIAIGDKPD